MCRKPRDEIPHKKTQYYLPGSDNLSVVTTDMLLKQLDEKKKGIHAWVILQSNVPTPNTMENLFKNS